MKKKLEVNFPFRESCNLLRIMKLSFLFMYLGLLQSYANSYSQMVRINLKMENAELKDVIYEIEKQTEFVFFYSLDDVQKIKSLNINVQNAKLDEILDNCFEKTGIVYEIKHKAIVLKKGIKKELDITAPINQQPDKILKGKVKDEQGLPIPGVSIIIKGTTTGTVTDVDGNYSLKDIPSQSTLVFSFIGMLSQEIVIENQPKLDVVMKADNVGLEEVVVIGYGTQKKANLTGSVSSVGGLELNKRPTPNVENLLQGKIAGLQITQSSGVPGKDGAEMRIRGMGTFSNAGSNPLVLVDGVQGSLGNLDPDNIETISVLKDAASAAIYGARAANGVILVTTKKGANQPVTIDYHVTFGAQSATRLPDLVTNSADYMELWNEANERNGKPQYFSQEVIDAYRQHEGMNDSRYPNFNWVDHIFNTAFIQKHHLSINGGNEKTSFNLALGFLDQGGIVDKYDFKRYNILLSVDSKVKNWLTIGGKVKVFKRDRQLDIMGGFYDAELMAAVFGSGPNYTPTMTLPDGSTGYVARYGDNVAEWTVRNPESILNQGSNTNSAYSAIPQIYAQMNLSKNLTWYTKGTVDFLYSFTKHHEYAANNYYFKDGSYAHNGSPAHLGVRNYMNTSFLTTFYSTLNYSKVFKEVHKLNILAGYNQESAYYRNLNASRKYFPLPTLEELNAGSPEEQQGYGSASEWAIQSVFGRVAYDYKSKFLFEINARYDGTSRIAPGTRWGLFPSVSGAWRVSEESFMKDVPWLDNLKFRASWGQLGNQNVGTYPYQDMLSQSQYVFGSQETAVYQSRMVDKSLKWEVTSITDFGLDANIKNGLFTITADWYNKITDDILYSVPVPASIGLSSPTINGGKMKNTGWEFEFGHRHKINEINYEINFNISTYKNEVLNIKRPSYGRTIIEEGLPYNSWYLTEWIGIFQTQEEIDNSAVHPYEPKPGDLKFKDQNNDGVIDSKDRKVFDGAFPDFYYGGSINMSWKNIDISAFFQGVQGLKSYVMDWGLSPFTQGAAPTKELAKNRWTGPGSTNKYPAIYRGGTWSNYKPVEGTESTFHLEDASYLRLKNLRIGYTLPTAIIQKIGMKEAQVYFSGDNLLTFTSYPGADPERTGGGQRFSVFPQLKTLSLGLKTKF